MKQVFAIGALGGSGTRVVAQVLMETGVYMGDDLNIERDNLIFNRLFKNPKWVNSSDRKDIFRRLKIFDKYMSGERWTLSESFEYIKASMDNPQQDKTKYYHFLFAAKKLMPNNHLRNSWGWKEPNSQVFLEYLFDYFPYFKYIHLIRHGLDMAYSKNNQQLFNWGDLFGVQVSNANDVNEIRIKQLDFWIETNKYVHRICNKYAADRFHLINFSNFCLHPEIEIPALLKFLNVNADEKLMNKLLLIPKITTEGRYRGQDLSGFTKRQLNQVRELGFEIEGTG